MKKDTEFLFSSFIMAYLENDILSHSMCLSMIKRLNDNNEILREDLLIIKDFVIMEA